jgi:hypothetical protein
MLRVRRTVSGGRYLFHVDCRFIRGMGDTFLSGAGEFDCPSCKRVRPRRPARPFEQCDPIYYAGCGSSYLNNYYTGFVTRGVCSGRGTHLACNVYGICWVACN